MEAAPEYHDMILGLSIPPAILNNDGEERMHPNAMRNIESVSIA